MKPAGYALLLSAPLCLLKLEDLTEWGCDHRETSTWKAAGLLTTRVLYIWIPRLRIQIWWTMSSFRPCYMCLFRLSAEEQGKWNLMLSCVNMVWLLDNFFFMTDSIFCYWHDYMGIHLSTESTFVSFAWANSVVAFNLCDIIHLSDKKIVHAQNY